MESHSSRLEQAEDRIAELKNEMVIKWKTEELLGNSRTEKGICKNSPTPSKDQTWESWALKKEHRCKQKEFLIYSTKWQRKFPKSRENYAHSGSGSLQDTKQTWPK
jgi:hypothetical protein